MLKISCLHLLYIQLLLLFYIYCVFRVVHPRRALVRELSAFHSMDYIECLKQVTNTCSNDCAEVENATAEHGLGKTTEA